uniref:classical arabinogalactan protein 9-like n=1 Tax=Halichoerus grypus TaxID=9711 RepID=UPI001658F835|nr:classical arabinogalactan protein 9-like [Halichoerus grypus]
MKGRSAVLRAAELRPSPSGPAPPAAAAKPPAGREPGAVCARALAMSRPRSFPGREGRERPGSPPMAFFCHGSVVSTPPPAPTPGQGSNSGPAFVGTEKSAPARPARSAPALGPSSHPGDPAAHDSLDWPRSPPSPHHGLIAPTESKVAPFFPF